MLRNKNELNAFGLLASALIIFSIVSLEFIEDGFSSWDFRTLDYFFRHSIKQGHGPPSSPKIFHLEITDNYYKSIGDNSLNRKFLSELNNALAKLGTDAVIYDIIFPWPNEPEADTEFTRSINLLGNVYLPIIFSTSSQKRKFLWEPTSAHERLKSIIKFKPRENGIAQPIHAIRTNLLQRDEFTRAAFNIGHINFSDDADGIFRHYPMLLKIDSGYIPSLPLAVFLDYVQVSLDQIEIHWGHEIKISASSYNFLDHDVIIPIDHRGFTYIPFVEKWGLDFKRRTAQNFLDLYNKVDQRGNLQSEVGGRFVFISDNSSVVSDFGRTPIDKIAPKVILHSSILNGLLTGNFYRQWPEFYTRGFLILGGLIGAFFLLIKRISVFYIAGFGIVISLPILTYYQFTNFTLLPITTMGIGILFIYSGLAIGAHIFTKKEQEFIQNAFSKYLPKEVVNQLQSHPEQLKLGGDESVATVLFSDIVEFTALSENLPPSDLVALLNNYLTEMTGIVADCGGIIDKFLGDAIMAEFGLPLPMENHAEKAVIAGLNMQKRLEVLRKGWAKKGLPQIRCRMGINTGPMLVGNMGSKQVFDYTVIGDSVNLASRLEGANKLYGTYLMISENTFQCLPSGKFRTRVLDIIIPKGKTKPVKVFEVYGEQSDYFSPEQLNYYQSYEEGFELYLTRKFHQSQKKFNVALSIRPNDLAAREMIDRVDKLKLARLPDNWDGSIFLNTK